MNIFNPGGSLNKQYKIKAISLNIKLTWFVFVNLLKY